MFYHASPVNGIKVLEPRISNHNVPLVYFSAKRENVLVYLSNAVEKYCRETGYAHEGKWHKWGSYGFTPDGILRLEEYYPNAIRDTYEEVSAYIYTADDMPDARRLEDIPDAFVSEEPVKVSGCEFVPDAYAAILEAVRQGKLLLEKYEEISDKKLVWIRETILREYQDSSITGEYRHFLTGKFPFLRAETAKPPLVILAGPTAAGKTALSIRLAKAVGGEIISADSMQVYRHMDIGSAKITPEEMQGVPHHLIDILEPTEDFNVVIFQQKCRECLAGIYERGHIPILTGGTGFYIQAILRDIDFTETQEDEEYRLLLEQLAGTQGPQKLHAMLQEADEASAEAIPVGNVKRVIRALEYHHLTGQRISEHNAQEKQRENAYNACYFILADEREALYQRIEQRVDEMLANGLVEEVKRLRGMGCKRGQTAMQGLGYKEILAYLEGECTLEEAVALIKRDTRHFAKRQLTWFRREKDVIWVNRQDFPEERREDAMLGFMLEEIRRRGIMGGRI